MLPLLKQCYDSAISARSLASAIKKGEVGSLRLAVAQTIDPSLITPHVVELGKLFQGLELKILRGNGEEVLGHLKQGDVELGIAAEIGDEWERLDSWPLFTEDFHLLVHSMHAFAGRPTISVDDLRQERLMVRTYSGTTDKLLDLLRARDFDVTRFHEVSADGDLLSLLEAGVGVALAPRSTQSPATLTRITVADLELKRTISLYGVAGRQRTAVAAAMMKMLRAYDWSGYAAA
jgi:DNA-binding transcriptional LysR family regulator